jgi:hypothetical protein
MLLRKIARMLRDWRLLNKPKAVGMGRSGVKELQAAKARVGAGK